jgi:hypothetical protein
MPLVSFCVQRLFRIRYKEKEINKDKKPELHLSPNAQNSIFKFGQTF